MRRERTSEFVREDGKENNEREMANNVSEKLPEETLDEQGSENGKIEVAQLTMRSG